MTYKHMRGICDVPVDTVAYLLAADKYFRLLKLL